MQSPVPPFADPLSAEWRREGVCPENRCLGICTTQVSIVTYLSDYQTVFSCKHRFVRLAWNGVKASAPSVSCIEDFITYFQGNWMSGAYPLSSWNVHNLSSRTNNHMEGWHSKLVGKAHPNVFEIVHVFKMEQAAVDVAVA